VFDMTGLRFMDSSGIALILEVSHRATSVSLRNPTPTIRRVVEATGLADILAIER
jgi:anti-anti-sigma factor